MKYVNVSHALKSQVCLKLAKLIKHKLSFLGIDSSLGIDENCGIECQLGIDDKRESLALELMAVGIDLTI